MIPNNTSVITTEGSLGGKRTQMTLDENSLAHIISVLTDMYSDEELACIREYSTNAHDSHVDAGQTRPIEVSTPTALSPYFIVRDFGVGLSVDEIEGIYSKYGASTKRESNDTNGTIGIGCKSALTYTNSFIMTAVQNGVKAIVAITRQSDGTGVIEIVDTSATNDPNGVEIKIPVKSANSFEMKADKFFSYWKPGTVLVNGQQPKTFDYDLKVNDNLYVMKNQNYWNKTNSYVVMGNVAYPVENADLGHAFREYFFVAFVPLGSVNFPPSREALLYTEKTEAVVRQIKAEARAGIEKAAREKVDSAKTHAEAYRLYQEYSGVISGNYTYKGKSMPSYNANDRITFTGYRWRTGAARYAVEGFTNPGVSLDTVNAVWIYGYTNASGISSPNKRKIRQYFSDNNITLTRSVYVGNNKPNSIWLDDVTMVDWKNIAAIRLNPVSTGRTRPTRPADTWDYWQSGNFNAHMSNLPKKAKLAYASPSEEYNLRYLTTQFPSDIVVVSLGKNRWDKFTRDNPGAKHVKEYAKEVAETEAKKVTEDYMTSLLFDYHTRNFLEKLDASKIDDPDVAKAIKIVKAPHSKEAKAYEVANWIAAVFGISVKYPKAKKVPNIDSEYPLANRKYIAHTTIYMNAVYKEGK